MKKTPQLLFALAVSGVCWASFLVPSVFAATFYQQLSDSSGQLSVNTNGCQNVGVISLFATTTVVTGSAGLAVANPGNFGSPSGFVLIIESAPQNFGCSSGATVYGQYSSPTYPAGDKSDEFMTMTADSPGFVLYPGTYYVVSNGRVTANPNWVLSSNFAKLEFYGYLTDNGVTSIPIAPGIPGFSDAGISTTSQAVYCNQNFSTSTTILQGLGADFAVGMCNVGVFLFVPSQSSLQNFADLGSTSQSKIPFSYFYGFSDIVNGLTASSTQNFTPFSVNLASTGVGSTSPISAAVLGSVGNFTYLSTTTIMTYVPQSVYDTLFLMAQSAIWIVVVLHLYHRIRPKHVTSV